MRGRLALTAVVALTAVPVVLILNALGAPIEFAVAWVLLLLAAATAMRPPLPDDGAVWPPASPAPARRGSDVSRLAWSINSRTGVAGHVIVHRLHATVSRRLLRHGLDLADPADHDAIDRLLGPGTRGVLDQREIRRADLARVLDVLERLPPPNKES